MANLLWKIDCLVVPCRRPSFKSPSSGALFSTKNVPFSHWKSSSWSLTSQQLRWLNVKLGTPMSHGFNPSGFPLTSYKNAPENCLVVQIKMPNHLTQRSL